MNYSIYIILFLTTIIIFSLVYDRYQNNLYSDSNSDSEFVEGFENDVPKVEFPFKNITNGETGKNLNIIAIAAPFREEKHERLYAEYKKKGLNLLGISSYLDFPAKIDNPFEDRFHEKRKHNYPGMVSTWVYCTREPCDIIIDADIPLLQLTEADLKDTEFYKPDISIKKEYDFMYVCLDDNDKCQAGWQSYNRNWDLAKKCLKIMCRNYKLKGLIVGRKNCKFTDFCAGSLKVLPFLEFHEFQKEMQKCKFLFAPNISDASPRVITEAMCYNMPVLVNYNILGGWHNVISGVTGEFLTSESDLGYALDKITKLNTYTPREWYIQNRGQHSRKKLANFLKVNYPYLNDADLKYANI